MKIAICGKGGVGKSTVAAALALTLAGRGERVLALDADPDANLAAALGVPAQTPIVPVSGQIALIEERTGAKIDEYGKVFKLNPEVADVAEKFALRHRGVDILVLGAVRQGGGGCACPSGTFIRALVTDLVLYKRETLIMDMEAGVEHLGRATARGVDVMIVVTEPGRRSVDCALTVRRMASEIGIDKLLYVGSKVASPSDEAFIADALGAPLAAVIPYSEAIRSGDRPDTSVLDTAANVLSGPVEALLTALGALR